MRRLIAPISLREIGRLRLPFSWFIRFSRVSAVMLVSTRGTSRTVAAVFILVILVAAATGLYYFASTGKGTQTSSTQGVTSTTTSSGSRILNIVLQSEELTVQTLFDSR